MNTVTYAVIALITPAFNGSGQRRCDSPRGFGSWKRILRISVYGKTTTKIAMTSADTQDGILNGSDESGNGAQEAQETTQEAQEELLILCFLCFLCSVPPSPT